MKRLLTWVLLLLVLGAAAWGGVRLYSDYGNKQAPSFRTAAVKMGDLMATIGATGTLEPDEVVDVGAQVAGQIISFGNDTTGNPVDYRSTVKEGMILAQIDDSTYQADLTSTNAQIDQAKAGVARAEADVTQLKANLLRAERDWKRAQALGPSEALSQTQYDQYQAAYDIAVANVAVGVAAVNQAQSAVKQAEASLVRVNRNLTYCTIKSPVDGVIIDRRVNIGQTVVASLNAPSLFLIAKDLRKMELWVPVNEADIGSIHVGQPVSFTVDAFPGQTFHGEVGKVRLNAVMTQNVVTFTVEVVTDNSSGQLLPYLTANVQFEAGRRENVMLVPNGALRWQPRPDQIEGAAAAAAPGAAPATDPAAAGRRGGRSGRGARGAADSGGVPIATTRRSEESTSGTVWVQAGNFVKPIKLRLGLTDGAFTEVVSTDQLSEGMQLVIGEQRAEAVASGPASPFMPTFSGRGGGGGGGRRGG